jgi:hypothetical protein
MKQNPQCVTLSANTYTKRNKASIPNRIVALLMKFFLEVYKAIDTRYFNNYR